MLIALMNYFFNFTIICPALISQVFIIHVKQLMSEFETVFDSTFCHNALISIELMTLSIYSEI